jgi:mono/diheme cytochrome c family protein
MNPLLYWLATAVAAAAVTTGAAAQTPLDIRQSLDAAARRESADFAGFSAQRGEAFFKSGHGRDWSCASCHTTNPLAAGRHAKTNKDIAPLAPEANAERFTRPDKVEKWFRRNCNDVLGRPCTAAEKGDVLVYLMSLKQ